MAYKLLSLFDGSGGFPLAGSLCGIEPVAASEVEPYPIAVTRSRLPGMKHLGDISKINGAEIEPVNIVTFGSPCQDLSVAGKRAGIKHESTGDEETTRSGLFMEAVRIIKEMRAATNGVYPNVILWENVPGAFSSNGGDDFRTVLDELIKIVEPNAVMPPVPKAGWAYADCYIGDGWSLAYRVFDAQYWGVPQRRRRIHLVLHLTGERAREILFERQGVRGYFEEGGAPWKGTAEDAERSSGADDRDGESNCLTPWDVQSRRIFTADGSWPALYGGEGGGHGYVFYRVGSRDAAYVDALPFDTTQITSPQNGNNPKWGDPCHPLAAGAHAPAVVCIPINDKATRYKGGGSDRNNDGSGNGLGVGADGDPCPTLTAGDRHAVCYAMQAFGKYHESDIASAMKARDYKDATDLVLEVQGMDCRNGALNGDLSGTLMAKPNGGFSYNCIHPVILRTPIQYIVRRLTPTECARLQGFADLWGVPDQKDDFTDEEYRFWLEVRNTHAAINGKAVKEYTKEQMLTWYNKLHTDSSEYKMWGNGIALPPALYCMQGIVEALKEDGN